LVLLGEDQALERVNQYLVQKPRRRQGRFIKGLILAEQNKVAEAIEVFTALARDYPSCRSPYNNLAVLYASQGQYEKSAATTRDVDPYAPELRDRYENLGDVYTKLASQAYDKALQFDSSNSRGKEKLSLIRDLMSSNRLPRASSAPSATPVESAQPPREGSTDEIRRPNQAAPVQVKPAAKKPDEPRAGTQDGNKDEVLQAVLDWASAWSRQTVETYLAFYAADFRPRRARTARNGNSRRERIKQTQKDRGRHRIAQGYVQGDSNAVVTFRQNIPLGQFENQQQQNAGAGPKRRALADPAGASWGLMSKRYSPVSRSRPLAFESLRPFTRKGRRVDVTADALLATVYDEICRDTSMWRSRISRG